MFRRIFFYCLILNFVPFTNVNSAESGGMPQLNPEYWISQIFWLTLSFGFLFVILSKFILPKISNNLELRKSQILENIEMAEKQKKESENKIKEYEALLLNSKNQARNYFNDARKKIQQRINLTILGKHSTIRQKINPFKLTERHQQSFPLMRPHGSGLWQESIFKGMLRKVIRPKKTSG